MNIKCLVENKTVPFPTNKQNSSDFFFVCLPVSEYFSYLLLIWGYLANVHITNWESKIKSPEKNKIFKRTCRGCGWLTRMHTKPIISFNLFVGVLERIPYSRKASKSSWLGQWNNEDEMYYFCFNFKIQPGHNSRAHFGKLIYNSRILI